MVQQEKEGLSGGLRSLIPERVTLYNEMTSVSGSLGRLHIGEDLCVDRAAFEAVVSVHGVQLNEVLIRKVRKVYSFLERRFGGVPGWSRSNMQQVMGEIPRERFVLPFCTDSERFPAYVAACMYQNEPFEVPSRETAISQPSLMFYMMQLALDGRAHRPEGGPLRVLEIGSGTGNLLLWLARLARVEGWQLEATGVELNAPLVSQAVGHRDELVERHGPDWLVPVEFVCADGRVFGEQRAWDAVVLSAMAEPDDTAFIEYLAGLLSQDGRAVAPVGNSMVLLSQAGDSVSQEVVIGRGLRFVELEQSEGVV